MKLLYIIHPTPYGDYDLIAIGDEVKLRALHKKLKGSDYLKGKERDILLIDTYDDIFTAVTEQRRCVEKG